MNKWHNRHMGLACHVAQWSKDPTTKVGAVVIGADRRQLAIGYNGFPPGVDDRPERYNDRPTKYLFTQHAERNALDNAQFDLRGGSLITTMFPCVECAKSLVAKGIKTLVSTPVPEPVAFPSWRDTIPVALTILKEARVACHFLEPILDDAPEEPALGALWRDPMGILRTWTGKAWVLVEWT
jgi:dCMP deaminase